MDERFRRVEQVEQRVQMLLGSLSPTACCPWSSNPRIRWAISCCQHLETLEQKAEEKLEQKLEQMAEEKAEEKAGCGNCSQTTSPRSTR